VILQHLFYLLDFLQVQYFSITVICCTVSTNSVWLRRILICCTVDTAAFILFIGLLTSCHKLHMVKKGPNTLLFLTFRWHKWCIWSLNSILKCLVMLWTKAPETSDSLERLASKPFATTTEPKHHTSANTLVLVWDMPGFESFSVINYLSVSKLDANTKETGVK
jgi:hypothetical protein